MDMFEGIVLNLTLADRRKQKKAASTAKNETGPAKPKAAAPHRAPAPKDEARRLPPLRFEPLDWTPLSRLVYIGVQECPCCGQRTKYVAGDLIRYSQKENVGGHRTTRTRAFSAKDQRFAHLPRVVEELPVEIHECHSCIGAKDAIDAVLFHTHAVQIPLFAEHNPPPVLFFHRNRGKHQHKPNFDLHQPTE